LVYSDDEIKEAEEILFETNSSHDVKYYDVSSRENLAENLEDREMEDNPLEKENDEEDEEIPMPTIRKVSK
jgi:hypothetical protein